MQDPPLAGVVAGAACSLKQPMSPDMERLWSTEEMGIAVGEGEVEAGLECMLTFRITLEVTQS